MNLGPLVEVRFNQMKLLLGYKHLDRKFDFIELILIHIFDVYILILKPFLLPIIPQNRNK